MSVTSPAATPTFIEYSNTDFSMVNAWNDENRNQKEKSDEFSPLQPKSITPEVFNLYSEVWVSTFKFQAQVLQITKEQVICECLLEENPLLFETRVFSRSMFNHIKGLKEKSPVYIKIQSKPGSSRIDVYDGKGIVNEKIFEVQSIWDELENSGLDKPFFSK